MSNEMKGTIATGLLAVIVVISVANDIVEIGLSVTGVTAILLLLLKVYNGKKVMLVEILQAGNFGMAVSLAGHFISPMKGDNVLSILIGSVIFIIGIYFLGSLLNRNIDR